MGKGVETFKTGCISKALNMHVLEQLRNYLFIRPQRQWARDSQRRSLRGHCDSPPAPAPSAAACASPLRASPPISSASVTLLPGFAAIPGRLSNTPSPIVRVTQPHAGRDFQERRGAARKPFSPGLIKRRRRARTALTLHCV